MANPKQTTVRDAIKTIRETNEKIRKFWSKAHGWAPKSAADVHAKSRLDRQVALSDALSLWVQPRRSCDREGQLILAWINLGALMEGSLKTFLCVFLEDYRKSSTPLKKFGKTIDPDEATIEGLRTFFVTTVWDPQEVKRWDKWVSHVQQRRNAVHAFRDRDIGNFSEFHKDIIEYSQFLLDLEDHYPYPD